MLFAKNPIIEALVSRRSRPRRWSSMPLGSRIALVFMLVLVACALFAPLIARHDPSDTAFSPYQPPNGEFWFGTDNKSRDVFARVMFGARYSLVIGLLSVAFALALGVLLGAIAAVARPWVGELVMRVLDVFMSVPGIALATVFVAIFGPSMASVTIAIGILYVPQIARVVRANIISEYGKDYVRAVVVSGARAPWILAKHVARNIAAPVMVFTTLSVADAIVFEASLSFIGMGVNEAQAATWGNILSTAKDGVILGYWWQALFPGMAIMLTVLCLNILSEGITDAMVAAPNAPVVETAQDADNRRRADRILVDPVEAYRVQHDGLLASLAALREAELSRCDRLVPESTAEPVLEVRDLCIRFPRYGDVNVVDHLSFAVRPGETMGLVGESGCGKSISSLAIMGLLDPQAQVSGEIVLNGVDLLRLGRRQRNAMRGHEIAMIYQDALSSLNPSMLIKAQMKQLTRRGGTRSAEELLDLVGLDPRRTLNSYPHELSGGQRQRVLIAMALTRDPKLIIADEPTTALDVTVQKQVIDLLNDLRRKLGFAMVFVSHDLALVAKVAHSVTVMYAGQVVEQGSMTEILTDPRHEYTRGLLAAVTSIEGGAARLHQVPGTVPSPSDFTDGDRFAPRSSHPNHGLHVRPVMKQVPDTWHFVAEQPDDPEPAPKGPVSEPVGAPPLGGDAGGAERAGRFIPRVSAPLVQPDGGAGIAECAQATGDAGDAGIAGADGESGSRMEGGAR